MICLQLTPAEEQVGAYLSADCLFMVSELMAGDLWSALADDARQQELHWDAMCACFPTC